MWAAKLPGEGVFLWEACKAMCDVMGQLGVAIDGGKDSLSMAARVGDETVKAPGCCLCVYVVVYGFVYFMWLNKAFAGFLSQALW